VPCSHCGHVMRRWRWMMGGCQCRNQTASSEQRATCPNMQQTKCFAFKAPWIWSPPPFVRTPHPRISKDTAGHQDNAGSSAIFAKSRRTSRSRGERNFRLYMPPLQLQRGRIESLNSLSPSSENCVPNVTLETE